MPHRLIWYSYIYVLCMSPTLNGSSVLQRFECGNVVEIRNRIMFDFYPGLPHISHVLILDMYQLTIKTRSVPHQRQDFAGTPVFVASLSNTGCCP